MARVDWKAKETRRRAERIRLSRNSAHTRGQPQGQTRNTVNTENLGQMQPITSQNTNSRMNGFILFWRRAKELCVCFFLSLFPAWSADMYIEEQRNTMNTNNDPSLHSNSSNNEDSNDDSNN